MSRRRFAWRILLPLLLSAAAAGCAAPGGSQQISSTHLPTILEEVRAHPEKREAGETACQRSIKDGDFSLNLFAGGFFDVPAPMGNSAFCAAIIDAVIAGDLTRSDVNAFKLPSDVRGRGPLGTLLRKLMIAHERLRAQQAQVPAQTGLPD